MPPGDGPWLDAAANAAPYLAAAVMLRLRDRPWWHRVAGGLASLLLVAVLAPVGSAERARDGWLIYLIVFAVVGVLSWIALGIWWLAWQFWRGRFGSRWPDNLFSSTGSRKKHSFPLLLGFFAFWIGSLPWIWPLSSLPFGQLWTWTLFAAWVAGFLVVVVLQGSERPPRFLVPPYMRPATASSGRGDFLPMLAAAVVAAGALAAVTLFLLQGPGLASGWIKAAVFVIWALLAATGAGGFRRRRPAPSEPSGSPPSP